MISSPKPRIYADFNRFGPQIGASLSTRLSCVGSTSDIKTQGLELREGLEVILYQPDDVDSDGNPDCLEVEGVVKLDVERNEWIAIYALDMLGYRSNSGNLGVPDPKTEV
jgi:hypothetical protein